MIAAAVASASAFSPASGFAAPMTRARGAFAAQSAPAAPRAARVANFGPTMAAKQVPHGGVLVDQMVKDAAEKKKLAAECDFVHQLSPRQLCDVELIMNGGLSPITGFMDQANYNSVVQDMRLLDGNLFGLPIVFDTDREDFVAGKKVLLMQDKLEIATFTIKESYKPDKVAECKKCYGETTLEHPGVLMVATERGQFYVGGEIKGLNKPARDFECRSPAEVRADLPDDKDVVAFQCRNPVHRAHYELFTRALDAPEVSPGAVVLVHPTCGPTQADDIPGDVRYRTYVRLAAETKDSEAGKRTKWDYLPYSMHMAGPREAIQHMMIRKNFGCTHFIIGRDMAGSKSSISGDDYYGAYDAQDFAKKHGPELGVTPVPSLNLVYTESKGYVTAEEAKEQGLAEKKLSGTKFRQMLRGGEDIPEWFAFKSVVEVLREDVMASAN